MYGGWENFDAKCADLTVEQLQLKWQHYVRQISGSSASTALSGIAVPFTGGLSLIGIAFSGPGIHNARKKLQIVDKHLNSRGAHHHTRKRDIFCPVAISGTVGVATVGMSALAGEAAIQYGVEYGVGAIAENQLATKIGTHAAVDAAVMAGEHAHGDRKQKKEAKKSKKN
ncbi:hypothetical protein ABW21_db0205364 [Orbilia brochopaga]|nr:hypothetical protein ABW21_db0205364 [Drechslerella brochopaga]